MTVSINAVLPMAPQTASPAASADSGASSNGGSFGNLVDSAADRQPATTGRDDSPASAQSGTEVRGRDDKPAASKTATDKAADTSAPKATDKPADDAVTAEGRPPVDVNQIDVKQVDVKQVDADQIATADTAPLESTPELPADTLADAETVEGALPEATADSAVLADAAIKPQTDIATQLAAAKPMDHAAHKLAAKAEAKAADMVDPDAAPVMDAATDVAAAAKPADSGAAEAAKPDKTAQLADSGDDQAIQPVVPQMAAPVQTEAPAQAVLAQQAIGAAPVSDAEAPKLAASGKAEEAPAVETTGIKFAGPASAKTAPTTKGAAFAAAVDTAKSGDGTAGHAAAGKAGDTGLANADPAPADGSTLTSPVLSQTFSAVAARPAALPYPTATTTATPSATVSVQEGQFGNDMGVQIARALDKGSNDLLIKLDPRHMGRIDVRLSFDHDGVLRAVMSADSSTAADMLRRESTDLNRALADAGVRADGQSLRFDTRASSDQAGQQSGGQNGSNAGGQGNSRWQGQQANADDFSGGDDPVYRSLRSSGHVDLMA